MVSILMNQIRERITKSEVMAQENKDGMKLQGNGSQQDKKSVLPSNARDEEKNKIGKEQKNQSVSSIKPEKDQPVNRAKPEMERSKTAGAPEMEAERPVDNKEEKETDIKAEKNDTAQDKAEDNTEQENKDSKW